MGARKTAKKYPYYMLQLAMTGILRPPEKRRGDSQDKKCEMSQEHSPIFHRSKWPITVIYKFFGTLLLLQMARDVFQFGIAKIIYLIK